MDNDGPPFVDFKCTYCKTILCKTDGDSVRMQVSSTDGIVYDSEYRHKQFRRLDFICPKCGLTVIWKRTYDRENDRRRKERKNKRQH